MFKIIFLLGYLFSCQLWALTLSHIASDPEWDSITWISTEARIENDPTAAYCNATWIANNLLVTAAHCISHAFVLGNKDIILELGSYQKHGFRGFAFIQRIETKAQFIFLPSLNHRLKQHGLKTRIHPIEDIAIIKLEQSINFPHLKVAKLLPEKYFKSIKNNPAHYWPTLVTINLFETITHTNSRQLAKLDQLSWTHYFKSTSTSRIAEGDSGAPLFFRVGSEWFIGAVVKGKGENYFNNWDAFTAINPLHALIKSLKD